MPRLTPLLILLLAFFLRVAGLDSLPPGWRDDEVIETTVHAQIVLDGGHPLYFIQAEGHEPLYHYLSAGWIALAGNSLFSVRMVSAFFGLLTVAAGYRLARQLFGARYGWLVALLLAVSFWALMYSRVKIRHIAELPFALLAFSQLLSVVRRQESGVRGQESGDCSFFIVHSSLFILFLTLALYTYFASLALPLILSAFGLYLFILPRLPRPKIQTPAPAHRSLFIVHCSLFIALLLYFPLARGLFGSAQRLSVVGGPLTALRAGDPWPFIQNTASTLAMFGNRGDPEWLYNISGQPLFGPAGFYVFAAGAILCLWRRRDPRYGFLLIWLIGGLAPAFASTPAASFGHSITALPAATFIAALPFAETSPRSALRTQRRNGTVLSVANALAIIFVALTALRDLPDYFLRWPADPQVRYLYKADLHATARALRGAPADTYVFDGPLSMWDRRAFLLDGVAVSSPPRWVNAEWAIVFPARPARTLFTPQPWQADVPPAQPAAIDFANGLTFAGWERRGTDVIAHWRAGVNYAAVEPPIGSGVASPPFPAFAFMHLLAADGSFVAGSDRFDVDAFTLQPGDRFLQRHHFDAPPGGYTLTVGLYDPTTGQRIPAADGRDEISLGTVTVP
ncbi:MAG: glycosyltransferase family 39 protein [Chloroflexi bacterium]|nr:glycosyltransferase family 39 protein [Chloroflexota bacterium]